MQIGDTVIRMQKGWIVQFTDGSVICEDDMHWIKVPKKRNIAKMMLKWNDRLWSIEGKEAYTVPKKRAYVDVMTGAEGIHSRTIGYYDREEKCKVIMRVDEENGKMAYEIEPMG